MRDDLIRVAVAKQFGYYRRPCVVLGFAPSLSEEQDDEA